MTKKSYNKPEIGFESFMMSESIAACGTVGNQAEGSCGIGIGGGWTVYIDESQGCNIPTEDGADNPCIHVPLGDNNVFGSM